MRAFIFTVMILLVMISQVSAAISVCDECEFTAIQDAVDFADEGELVEVGEGVFMENIVIDKPIELSGSNSIISPQTPAPAISVLSDDVSISGFQISYSFAGVQVEGAVNVSIENCFFDWDSFGVRVIKSSGIEIKENSFSDINSSAMYLEGSGSVIIENNSIGRTYLGIFATSSSENNISENRIANADTGILMTGSIDSVIEENEISTNNTGIMLIESGGNRIINNSVNTDTFFDMFLSPENFASMNSVECNVYARSMGSYNSFEYGDFILSGENFELSFFEAEVPDYVVLGKGINLTVIPDIYTDRGHVQINAKVSLEEENAELGAGIYNITSTPYMVAEGSAIEEGISFNANITESGLYGILVEKEKTQPDIVEIEPVKTTKQTIILVFALIFALAVLIYTAKRK